MDDADKILNTLKDSTNPKALTVKGDALYNLGNFEHALLNYHRAMRSSSTKVIQLGSEYWTFRNMEPFDYQTFNRPLFKP